MRDVGKYVSSDRYIAVENMGHYTKLKALLDRFDAVILELRVQYDGLENEKARKKSDVTVRFYFFFLGIFLGILGVFLLIKGEVIKKTIAVYILVPLPVYMIYITVSLFKAARNYNIYIENEKYSKYIKAKKIKTYYFKINYYLQCIAVLQKRRKKFADLLVRIENGQEITPEEAEMIENAGDDLFRIPELGFTFRKTEFSENVYNNFK